MSTRPREVALISASPKATEKSMSEWLTQCGETRMKGEDLHITRIHVRKSIGEGRTEEDFAAMLSADALVFLFPLYIFCLPGMLMRFLQDFHQYYRQHKGDARGAKVYAVVNCGFPEPDINGEAVRVIQSFAEKIEAQFRFGVLIGGGPMIWEAKDAPFMKKVLKQLDDAFLQMKKDIVESSRQSAEEIRIAVRFPRKLYFFMGGRGWESLVRKNGLEKGAIYRKPYRE